jgi:hypothetical protein
MVVVVVAAAVPSKIWMIVTSTYYSLVVMWMEEPNVMIVAAAFCILVEYFCLPKNMYLPPLSTSKLRRTAADNHHRENPWIDILNPSSCGADNAAISTSLS